MRKFVDTTVVSYVSLITASCLLLSVHNTAANEIDKTADPIVEQRNVIEGLGIYVDSSGDSRIEINSSMKNGVVTSVVEDGVGLTIYFPNTDLAPLLRRRFDMSDFGDTVLHIEAFPAQLTTQFVVTRVNEKVEFYVSQSGRKFTIDFIHRKN